MVCVRFEFCMHIKIVQTINEEIELSLKNESWTIPFCMAGLFWPVSLSSAQLIQQVCFLKLNKPFMTHKLLFPHLLQHFGRVCVKSSHACFFLLKLLFCQWQDLQRDIEQHTAGVESVFNICEVLLHDSDACANETECDSIQQTTRSLDRRWRNICAMSMERRMK